MHYCQAPGCFGITADILLTRVTTVAADNATKQHPCVLVTGAAGLYLAAYWSRSLWPRGRPECAASFMCPALRSIARRVILAISFVQGREWTKGIDLQIRSAATWTKMRCVCWHVQDKAEGVLAGHWYR